MGGADRKTIAVDIGSDVHKVLGNSGPELQNKEQRRRILPVKENGLINLSGRAAMMTDLQSEEKGKAVHTKQRDCGSNGNKIR